MKTSKAGFARGIAAAGAIALVLLATGCDEEESSDIDSTEEFCASIKDIDDRFQVADEDTSDFDKYKDQYAEINERLETLLSSIDVVPEADREAVEESVNWAHDVTELVGDVDSQEELEETFFAEDGIMAQAESLDPAGAEWILDNCGIEI